MTTIKLITQKPIPKKQRIAIYKEAIKRIEFNNHGNSGLCNLFALIAKDLYSVPWASKYYYIHNYPELKDILLRCNYNTVTKSTNFIDNDRGFSTAKGITKRLNILKDIVKQMENK